MVYLYKAMLDDIIHTFMQVANYILWLKGGPTNKNPNFAPLKLKTTASCGDHELLAYAIKSYPGAKDLDTRDFAWEGLELFGSMKHELDLPP